MAQGLRSKTERILQIVPEDIAGTLSAANAPILLSNTTHDWQENNDYDSFRQSGYTADEYNAILEQEANIDIDFVPYYNLLDDELLQFIMNTPSGADDVTAGGKRTRIWKWLQTGRVNRRTFTAEEGRTDNARRGCYGLVPEASISSERGNGGKCRGKWKIITQKAAEPVLMTGQGARNEVQTIASAVAVVLSAQGTGTAQTITPGDTLAAISTALAANLGKANGSIVATVTSVAAGGGTINSVVLSGSGTASANGTYTPSGTYGGVTSYQIGTTAAYLCWDSTNLRWFQTPSQSMSSMQYYSPTAGASPTSIPTSGWLVSSATAPAPTVGVNATGGTPGSLAITATFSGASVANTSQPLFTTSTPGVTITRTQAGGNGVVTSRAVLPIEPQHWKFSRAANYADLGLPSASLGTVEKMELVLAGLVTPKYFHNNQDTYTQHVDGENPEATVSLLLPTDEGSDHCSVMQNGAKQYISAPQWFRLQAVCPDGIHMITIEFYGSIKDNIPYSFSGNVEEREFKLSLLRNPSGDFNLRITTVVAV